MSKAITILLVVVGIVIVAGAVLHSVLLPDVQIPEWLAVAVSAVVVYLFGRKQEVALGAFKLKKKK